MGIFADPTVVIQLIGIAGSLLIILVIVAFGWAKSVLIDDVEAVRDRLRVDFPEYDLVTGHIADDQKTALLELEKDNSSSIALVSVIGDKWATRLLRPTKRELHVSSAGLTVDSRDAGTPAIEILMPSKRAQHWFQKYQTCN